MATKRPAPTRQVNFRLSVTTIERLKAARAALGVDSQARIIDDAVEVYLDAMPADKRRVIDSILALRKSKS